MILQSYFLETILAIVNYTYRVCLYVNLYAGKGMVFGLGLYMNSGGGGGVFKVRPAHPVYNF